METLANIILILLCLILVYNYYEINILSVNDDKKTLEKFINLKKINTIKQPKKDELLQDYLKKNKQKKQNFKKNIIKQKNNKENIKLNKNFHEQFINNIEEFSDIISEDDDIENNNHSLRNKNFLTSGFNSNVNSFQNSTKNSNQQLRKDIVVPKTKVNPWLLK